MFSDIVAYFISAKGEQKNIWQLYTFVLHSFASGKSMNQNPWGWAKLSYVVLRNESKNESPDLLSFIKPECYMESSW